MIKEEDQRLINSQKKKLESQDVLIKELCRVAIKSQTINLLSKELHSNLDDVVNRVMIELSEKNQSDLPNNENCEEPK